MQMKSYAIITAAALAAIGAGAFLWSRTEVTTAQDPAALSESRAEVARLRAELSAKSNPPQDPRAADEARLSSGVMQRLALLEQKLAASPAIDGAAPDSAMPQEPLETEAEAARAMAEREAQIARNEAHVAELRGTLDNQLAIDSFDPEAETRLHKAIDTAFADGTFDGSEITQVECGSSLCKLEIQSSNLNAQETFVAQYGAIEGLMEGESLASRVENADGSYTTVLYSMRGAGARLPQLALSAAQNARP